jgi:glycosyltransferase involved in cell wall biosynthesis
MRIALVYDAIYPWSVGGGEFHVHELARHLAARGHDVHVVGMQWWDGPSTRREHGVTFHGLAKTRGLYSDGAKRRYFPPIKFAVACVPFFTRERFDIVDCCAMPYFPALAIAPVLRARRTPLVLTWFEVWGPYWRTYLGQIGRIGQAIEWVTAKVGLIHLAHSPLTAERLARLNPLADVHYAPSGVEVPHVELLPEPGRIGWFGRAVAHKNLPLLLNALALLHDVAWRLSVISSGPALDDWKVLAEKLGLSERIEWIGFLAERKDLYRELARCEIVVQTSLREGQGKAALEAVLLGVPLICVRHPDVATTGFLTHAKDAWLIDTPEAGPLSSGVRAILADHAVRSAISATGRILATQLSWTRTANLVEAHYSRILETPSVLLGPKR